MGLMQICPKCGKSSAVFLNHECMFCYTEVVTTTTTVDELNSAIYEERLESLEQEICEKYVFPSPEYDEEIFNKRIEWEKTWNPKEYNDRVDRANGVSRNNFDTPHCPTCNSTDITQISGFEKGASILALGIFSGRINKTFKCKNCGYSW